MFLSIAGVLLARGADRSRSYGSIGVVIAMLLWMFLLALTSLFGCAFNAELDRLRAARASVAS